MFDSPILDVTIGLIFIFLMYSLLATSINEGLAALFSLRSRMLKKAIVSGMLSDTPGNSILAGIVNKVFNLVRSIPKKLGRLFKGETEEIKKIGDAFFAHPLIRSYGSSRLYPLPSYISSKNFAAVLLDILKNSPNNDATAANVTNYPDIVKIKKALEYYSLLAGSVENKDSGKSDPKFIEDEPLRIFIMKLAESNYNIDAFRQNLESWYDDTMDRVSGWYKRQVQFVLFILGLIIAIVFNVDTIKIAGKLSTDKVTRDKLAQMAITVADKYQNDPGIKKTIGANGTWMPDTGLKNPDSLTMIYNEYQQQMKNIRDLADNEISGLNKIIALGWNLDTLKTSSAKTVAAPLSRTIEVIRYVLKSTFTDFRWLGFLITALAICLGAPFWFDLLNKVVRIRTSGKKEVGGDGNNASDPALAMMQEPATPISVNSILQPGEEAAG